MITFAIFNVIPNGDPALRLAGHSATPATIATIRREWGFDKPVYVQYARTMEKIFNGHPDLVHDPDQRRQRDQARHLADDLAGDRRRADVDVLRDLPGHVLGAVRAGKLSDRFLTVLALVGISMPVFWVGALLSYYLGFKAGIFPERRVHGAHVRTRSSGPTHLILPWIALSILFIGVYSRLVRSSILDTINEDFVRTARAKGLGQRRRCCSGTCCATR